MPLGIFFLLNGLDISKYLYNDITKNRNIGLSRYQYIDFTKKNAQHTLSSFFRTQSRGRTGTGVNLLVFETSASTDSAIWARADCRKTDTP